MSEQLDLFDTPSLNPVARVKESMRQAIKISGLARGQVADKVNELARIEGFTTNGKNGEVTTEMLDKWLAPGAEHIIPWKLIPIFCRVVRSSDPIKALAQPLGAQVIDREDAALLKWAKVERERRKIVKQQKALGWEIGI